MNIAIIGSGNVGGALALKWAKAGHTILLGVRDVENFKGKELLSNLHPPTRVSCSQRSSLSIFMQR